MVLLLAGCNSSDKDDGPSEISPIGSLQLSAGPHGILVSGSTAYLTAYSGGYGGKVLAVDVTNPTSPALLREYVAQYQVPGIGLSGGNLYAFEQTYGVIDQWDTALIELDAATLTPTGRRLDFDGFGTDMAIESGVAYLAFAEPIALRIVDLASFAVRGSHSVTGGSFEIAVSGSRCYLAGQSVALEIVDISNPAAPSHVGSLTNDLGSSPLGLSQLGSWAWLGCGGLGLCFVSVADETAPAFAGNSGTEGWGEGSVALGNRVFLADGDAGVSVFDISNPGAPTKRAILRTSHYAKDVFVSGDRLFAAAIDTSAPMDPRGTLEVFDIAALR